MLNAYPEYFKIIFISVRTLVFRPFCVPEKRGTKDVIGNGKL